MTLGEAMDKYIASKDGILSPSTLSSYGYIRRNNLPSLAPRTPLPQKEKKEQQILEPEQIAALLSAVEGDVMELPVLMGVWLCMRASEITALTWDCVDFQHSTLTIF